MSEDFVAVLREALKGPKGLDLWEVLVALRGPDLPSRIAVPLKLIFTARLRALLLRDAAVSAVARAEPKMKTKDLCDVLVNLPEYGNVSESVKHYLTHVARAFVSLPGVVDLSGEERSECYYLSMLAHALKPYVEGDSFFIAKCLKELPDWMVDIEELKALLKTAKPELHDKLFSDLEGESNGARGGSAGAATL